METTTQVNGTIVSPHGHGKYLWTDGCMYIGEWYNGKTMGKGKFGWPSGATYEGEFKSGYMDGIGTYTGPSGDTYRGQCVMNLKHGHGIKSYANGDVYDGEWRRGLQEAQGNGCRYDGFWDDGFPSGNGTFKWDDGSFYVGHWSQDPEEMNVERVPPVLPSQKKLSVWNSSKRVEKPRRISVDGRVSVGLDRAFEKMNMWGSESGEGASDIDSTTRRDLDAEIET
ncbi:hypothetical protein HID58_094802 [Brassica napus]|uniref:Uncharacterized protein n=1 Tax=Brassica napus TaxID=3708 RepID=A0ABQ7X656_BRANA|nr:hypothetical protein HID58_094802 [Brassica napus]